jgi:hypothetical protein
MSEVDFRGSQSSITFRFRFTSLQPLQSVLTICDHNFFLHIPSRFAPTRNICPVVPYIASSQSNSTRAKPVFHYFNMSSPAPTSKASSGKWDLESERKLLLEMLEIQGLPTWKQVVARMGDGYTESSCRFVQAARHLRFIVLFSHGILFVRLPLHLSLDLGIIG